MTQLVNSRNGGRNNMNPFKNETEASLYDMYLISAPPPPAKLYELGIDVENYADTAVEWAHNWAMKVLEKRRAVMAKEQETVNV
jgi:hypothetical protein